MDKNQTMAMMNCQVDDNLNVVNTSGLVNTSDFTASNLTNTVYSCWDYWHRDYYPTIIHNSYPVYIRERSEDKGKQAFEIIKMLKDKRFIKLETVADFIDAMDALIKII